ncbi:hypothetical protein [Sorangium cellulosum]|uniref:Uncharacterized protein n=1 Tax=Sorangium cellulosum TaxID=56 RepID=A0A150QG24_SORCE|nr:hypothetical protein [Sorangium cellulosum]KYF66924.1 hypothetical protein BE15_30170 [Sorangium cellulosum]
MPNRRANKKLRARVLARMSEAGESYQKALAHLLALAGAPAPAPPAGDRAGARPRRPSVREAVPASPLLLYQQAVALLAVADEARRLDGEPSSAAIHAEALATFALYWRASGRSGGAAFRLGGDAARELRAGAELVERTRSAARRWWLRQPASALAAAALVGRGKR